MKNKNTIERLNEDVAQLFKENPFIVFLCGPTLTGSTKGGATLRKKLKEGLELEDFEVVLGEDDGLEELRVKFGQDAQTNEKFFIQKYSNAVILIASSVGTYCELGLFSDHIIHGCEKVDFILILDKKYEAVDSYLNYGPAALVKDHGKVYYVDLDTFDPEEIIHRLIRRRSVFVMDNRGRPYSKTREK